MPRWLPLQALCATIMVLLVCLVIGLMVQHVLWDLRHPVEAAAADQAAYDAFWRDRHSELLARRRIGHALFPCPACPTCPPGP